MNKGICAKENFLSGLNCSQSVVLAFSEELKLDKEELKKLSIGFGGGMGRQRLVCGAVSGMIMVLSYLLSDGEDKTKIYSIIQDACNEFKNQLGSLSCGDLLSGKVVFDNSPIPEDRSNDYYKKRPCAEICEIAGNIAEKYVNSYSIKCK